MDNWERFERLAQSKAMAKRRSQYYGHTMDWLEDCYQGRSVPDERVELFLSLVFAAARHIAPGPLVDYLLSKETLSQQDREALCWLINKLIRSRAGRPRGKTKGPVWDAERWIASYAEAFRNIWRAERAGRNRKRVPKDLTIKEIERLKGLAEEQFPAAKGKISTKHILSMLK
jgi:hypothetical protein